MAIDMFLKLEGIQGESLDSKHQNEIDLLSWSWGMSQSGTTHMGGGSGGGKVSFQDINFTHYIDKASVTLMQFCTQGKHINKGVLTIRKAGGNPLEYFVVHFDDIIVTNLHTGGTGSEDRLTENVTLNFGKFEVKYQKQAESGAAEGGPVSFKWDIRKNVMA